MENNVKFNALLDKCVVANASGRKCFSLAILDDEDIRWMAEECPAAWLADVVDDGGNNLHDLAVEKGYIMPEGGVVGKFPGSDLDIVNIGGRLFVLDGWNGEKWTDCRECADRWNIDPSGTVYEIAPVYDWDLYDEDAGAFIDADGKIVDGLVDYMLL